MNDIRMLRLRLGPFAASVGLVRAPAAAYLTVSLVLYKLTLGFTIGALD